LVETLNIFTRKIHFYPQVKTIYVKNLPENASKEKIKELFDKHGEVTKVVLPPAKAGHKRDFGFVHFAKDQAH
jgi:heterogeneous nuclear ribonucleoprotein R